MSRKHVLVVDNYDSFTWNLVHYLEEVGANTEVVRNDALSVEEALQKPKDGVVLSPGPCTPNEAGICVEMVRNAPATLPIIGVCLGHQSIGQAFGGEVIGAKEIRHGKRSKVTHDQTGLFKGMDSEFTVVRYHSLSVNAENLPDCLIANAHTDDGEIMAMHHAERPVFGVQFHPESILTDHGHALLENWLKLL